MSQGISSILSSSTDTAQLRLLASRGDSSANSEVLQQFEALFLQNMLKSMRSASLGSSLFQSDQLEFYRDMYDQQIATDLANKEMLGISTLLNRQLGLNRDSEIDADKGPEKDAQPGIEIGERMFKQYIHSLNLSPAIEKQAENSEIDAVPTALGVPYNEEIKRSNSEYVDNRPKAFKPSSPDEFVNYAYQYSRDAADRIGVNPEVLVAIAALETGWGNHLPNNEAGTSNNYFGIKADQRWQGEAVSSETLEFEDGVFNKLKQSFRSYESVAESFNDFAEFVLGNERYSKAVEIAHDAKQFLQEIQNAGYATDPRYAEKVLNVLGNKAFAGVKQ